MAKPDSAQPVAGGVLGHVRQLVAEKGLVDPSNHLQDRTAHPFDTHPELAERLEALGLSLNNELRRRAIDPAPGPLLEQFGLEAAGPENTENTAQSTAADIRSTVESEFREIAAVKRDVKLKDLRQVAAQGVERLVLYKGSAKQIIATAAIALICASGTAIAARSGPSVAAWMVALCWALTLLFLAFTVTTWRQRNRRFMTLTADGLRFGNLPSPMPWRAITSTSIKTMWINGTSVPFAILVDLSRDFPAPSPRPGRFSGIAYVAAKHQFILTTGNTLRVSSKAAIESRDLEMLFGDFNRTWQAGLARAELARMGEAFAPGTEHHPA